MERTFDLTVYDLDAIERAIDDYKKVCNIKLKQEKGKAILDFKTEKEYIIDEFSNYVLELMKIRG